MEQKGYSLNTIFLVILIISFVSGFLGLFPLLIWENLVFQDPFTRANTFFYFSLLSIIGFIINPILLFIGFYRIGKKFDLKSNLKSSIIRLMTSAYLGRVVGITAVYLIGIFLIKEYTFYWPQYLSSIFSVAFIGTFFTAFTALAIAYLRQNESEIQ